MGRQRKNVKEGREARHRAVLFAPLDVVLSLRDVVQPDLFLISNARMHRLTRENVQGAPDLVVEVVSKSSRQLDRKLKRAFSGKDDVLECRVADPELRILEVFRREEAGRLARVAEFEDAGALTTPLLPGLEINLTALGQPGAKGSALDDQFSHFIDKRVKFALKNTAPPSP